MSVVYNNTSGVLLNSLSLYIYVYTAYVFIFLQLAEVTRQLSFLRATRSSSIASKAPPVLSYKTQDLLIHFLYSLDCRSAGIPYKHAYDRGVAGNFADVFGPGPWYLALLPSLRPPSAATSEGAYDSDEEASSSSALYGSTQQPPQQQRAHRPRGIESNGSSSGKGLGETGVVRRPLWEHNHPAQHSSTGSGSSIATTTATTMKHCECDSSNDRNAKCEV